MIRVVSALRAANQFPPRCESAFVNPVTDDPAAQLTRRRMWDHM